MKEFCSHCGEKLDSRAAFCASCGSRVSVPDTKGEPDKNHTPPPVPSRSSETKMPPPVRRKKHGSEKKAVPPLPTQLSGKTPEAIFREARKLPWKHRPEAWWDTFSVLAGTGSGIVWLAYSSVRGLPKPEFMSKAFGSMNSWIDLIPALALLLYAWIKRRALASRIFRFQDSLLSKSVGSRIGIMIAIIGGALFVSKIAGSLRFLQSGEGLDIVTPAMMALFPMALVLFRKETDQLLGPIQPLRKHLSPIVALGASVAVPFAVAHFLYHGADFKMYNLMQTTLPIGMLGSYALVRNPILTGKGQPPRSLPGSTAIWIFILVGVSLSLGTGYVLADDFLSDPFNLNDGLRTNTWAPWLAGVPTAVVSMTVNGVEVVRVIVQGKTPVEDGETPGNANFQVVVRSTDAAGATATTLAPGGTVFVLAHCEKEGKPFPGGDSTIRFAQQDAAQHITMTKTGNRGMDRSVQLQFVNPIPAEPPPTTMTVMVSAGKGGLISAPVTISLQGGEFVLEFF